MDLIHNGSHPLEDGGDLLQPAYLGFGSGFAERGPVAIRHAVGQWLVVRRSGSGLHQEWPQKTDQFVDGVELSDSCRGGYVVDDNAGIGGRVKVGGEQVDVALPALRAFEKSRGQADPLQEDFVAVKLRLRMRQRSG